MTMALDALPFLAFLAFLAPWRFWPGLSWAAGFRPKEHEEDYR
jgi:hypothetical protein